MKKEKNRGDKRSGVADSDPPDEIHDREAPANGNVDAPDSDALDDEPGDGHGKKHHDAESQAEPRQPAE